MTSTQRRALKNRILDAIYEAVQTEHGDVLAQDITDELDHEVFAAIANADVYTEKENR